MQLNTSARAVYGPDHEAYREHVRAFFQRELVPNLDRWEASGVMDDEFWRKCGAAGLLCPQVPVEYGGQGLDFLYAAIVGEEISYERAVSTLAMSSDIVLGYLLNRASEHLKHKYLPGFVSGEHIPALAITEPDAGSDVAGIRTVAVRDGDDYVINGSKTYITNGANCTVVLVVTKTDPSAGAKGISLFLVDRGTPGFVQGRPMDKIGQGADSTSELFFDDVRVPASQMIGEENKGFGYLMEQLPEERLSIVIAAQAAAQRAFDEAVAYTKQREMFGKTVFDFQNTAFTLASMAAKLQVGWAHLDWVLQRHTEGEFTAVEAAAMKLWHTEMQWEVVDAALQLHGSYGYMNASPIARLWRDARCNRIAAGSSEVMKLVISRSL
jgi:acyl-CoA dehydrogenase